MAEQIAVDILYSIAILSLLWSLFLEVLMVIGQWAWWRLFNSYSKTANALDWFFLSGNSVFTLYLVGFGRWNGDFRASYEEMHVLAVLCFLLFFQIFSMQWLGFPNDGTPANFFFTGWLDCLNLFVIIVLYLAWLVMKNAICNRFCIVLKKWKNL